MPNAKLKSGFSLVEILISLLFIGALVTILFTSTGSLFVRRQSNLQSVAAKIASKEIERLRGLPFSGTGGFTTQGNLTCSTNLTLFPDLAPPPTGSMPTGSCVDRIISDYAPSTPGQIYQVTVAVKWPNENNVTQNISMDTLIYQNGL